MIKNFAAIDIGSNAVRLLFQRVFCIDEEVTFKKIAALRIPIRLGSDVFKNGKISQKNEKALLKMLHSFNFLCELYQIDAHIICATSAMREAKNRKEVCQRLKEKTNLEIKIISGKEEAKILSHYLFFTEKVNAKKNYIFVDVGGGSTEIQIIHKDKKIAQKSFPIGGVRIKENKVKKNLWEKVHQWLNKNLRKNNNYFGIATGGNINSIYSILKKQTPTINLKEIDNILTTLKKLNFKEKIEKFKLNNDRADIIVEGGLIYYKIFSYIKVEEILVPKISIANYLIKKLYKDLFN